MTTLPVEPVARAVVIVAAGSGTRLGLGTAKAFVPVAGEPMLARALAPVFALTTPAFVVVVAPPDRLEETRDIVHAIAGPATAYTAVVAGGIDRHTSVEAGLAAVPEGVRWVAVHDAARCLTSVAQIDRIFAAVEQGTGGVIPVLPVTDTVKRVADDRVVGTVDRSSLVGVQTPQAFPLRALLAAYASASTVETDDAGVFAANGGAVRVVAGDPDAFKITTQWDLARAESILRERARPAAAAPRVRIGVGVDAHAFDDSVPCRLGLVEFPGEPGFAGHSDGDAVAHALCDAILSAGGLGDIGGRFGVADPRYAGAAGDVFIRGAVSLLAGAGLAPMSATVQVIGNRPRIGVRRLDMQEALAAALGAPVSVSGTTTDGMGFTGRGEGISAVATVLAVSS